MQSPRLEDRPFDRQLGLGDRLRPPDVEPKTIETQAEKSPFRGRGVKEGGEPEHVSRFAGEKLRFHDPEPV